MAVGRRDYTWGFLNETASEGRYTESFIKPSGGVISAGESSFIYSYIVLANYRLSINRIDISTNSRVINYVSIYISSVEMRSRFYSDDCSIIFSDKNPYYLSTGDEIKVQCHNYDEMACIFVCNITGGLEQLI